LNILIDQFSRTTEGTVGGNLEGGREVVRRRKEGRGSEEEDGNE
jgi:hypothetical protein